jgi:hypothetical protein
VGGGAQVDVVTDEAAAQPDEHVEHPLHLLICPRQNFGENG